MVTGIALGVTRKGRKMNLHELLQKARELEELEQECYKLLKPLIGRKVRITNEKYNGQPIGTSRKTLVGKTLKIGWAHPWNGTIVVGFWEYDAGLTIDGVEFLEEKGNV